MDNLRLMSLVRGGTELVLPVTPSAYAVSAGMRIETLNIHGLGDINVAGYPTLAAIGIDGFCQLTITNLPIGRHKILIRL